MSLIEYADKNIIDVVKNKVREDYIEYTKLDMGSKLRTADKLYLENRILKELGEHVIDEIEVMDEQLEVKDKKIIILESELKSLDSYDEEKINKLLYKDPVFRNNTRERAKKRLKNIFSNKVKNV